jgi:hypothetical protein
MKTTNSWSPIRHTGMLRGREDCLAARFSLDLREMFLGAGRCQSVEVNRDIQEDGRCFEGRGLSLIAQDRGVQPPSSHARKQNVIASFRKIWTGQCAITRSSSEHSTRYQILYSLAIHSLCRTCIHIPEHSLSDCAVVVVLARAQQGTQAPPPTLSPGTSTVAYLYTAVQHVTNYGHRR